MRRETRTAILCAGSNRVGKRDEHLGDLLFDRASAVALYCIVQLFADRTVLPVALGGLPVRQDLSDNCAIEYEKHFELAGHVTGCKTPMDE